jgi:hypothetical protein
MKKIILLASAVLFTTLVSIGQNNLDKSFTGVKKIKMSIASGDCKIQKSTGAGVSVSLRYTFTNGYQPIVEQEGDRLILRENWDRNNNRNNNGEATWTLMVPDGMDLSFHAGSSNLDISGLSLDLNAITGSGNLTFTNLKGDIRATTGSGDVELENFDGEISTTTGSGSTRVSQSKGDLTVTCGSGNVKIMDSEATFSATTGSGDVSGRNISIKGSSRFTSGSGNSELVLASTPQFNLSVSSGSGNAKLDFNGNEIKGEIVMKANKKNGSISAPFEFDKTEEIDNGSRYDNDITIQKTVVKGNGTQRISVSTGSGDAVIKGKS